jgi:hypothetical protein
MGTRFQRVRARLGATTLSSRSLVPFGALLALAACAAVAAAQEASGPLVRTASAGGVHLSVEVDRSALMIDDRLRLSMRVEAPPGTLVEFPDLTDRLGTFTVVGEETGEPRTGPSGSNTWERIYLLQPEGAGEVTLPSLAISYSSNAQTAAERLSADPLAVTVASVLPEGADLTKPKGIAPPVPLPPSRSQAGMWLSACVLLAILAMGLIGWRIRRRAREHPVRSQAAHLVALDQLERLQELVRAGQTVEFYIRLSETLRHYALWRFGLKALSRTTEELLADIAGLGGAIEAHRGAIGGLMADCDLVKFAKHQPSKETMQLAMKRARDFVERTGDHRSWS